MIACWILPAPVHSVHTRRICTRKQPHRHARAHTIMRTEGDKQTTHNTHTQTHTHTHTHTCARTLLRTNATAHAHTLARVLAYARRDGGVALVREVQQLFGREIHLSRVCVRARARVHACVRVRVHVCACVCVCLCACVSACMSARASECAQVCVFVRVTPSHTARYPTRHGTVW
jgi:hypothetical protein